MLVTHLILTDRSLVSVWLVFDNPTSISIMFYLVHQLVMFVVFY